MSLTPKQEMFVKEYLVDLNGTQAAIRAGYSERTANEQAARLLAKVSVKEAVQSAMDSRSKRVSVTAEDVLQSILDIRAEAREDKKHSEALKANELLGKHLKMFSDKLDVNHTGEIINVIERRVIKPSGDTPN